MVPLKNLDDPKVFQLPILGTQFLNPGYDPGLEYPYLILGKKILKGAIRV